MVISTPNVVDMQGVRNDADFDYQTVKTSKIYKFDNKTCYNNHPKNLDIDTPANFRKICSYNHKKNNKERTEEHNKEIKKGWLKCASKHWTKYWS